VNAPENGSVATTINSLHYKPLLNVEGASGDLQDLVLWVTTPCSNVVNFYRKIGREDTISKT
jgi:hypothetical protein